MLAVALALVLVSSTLVGDDLAIVNAQHGFRIARPDDSWRSLATDDQGDAKYALTLFPKGSLGLPSVVVYVAKWDGKATASELRDAAIGKLGVSGATLVEKYDREVGGRTAPSLKAKSSQPGIGDFYLEYDYVDVDTRMFVLQCAWGASEGEDLPSTLASIVGTFTTMAPEVKSQDPVEAKALELGKRCGSEIDWATNWDDASKRAHDEGKLVLAVFEVYHVIAVPRTSPSGVFMDTDLIGLLRERFVPLRIEEKTSAPFRDASDYGMGPSIFGTAFYCVDPAGHVVAETSVYDCSYLDEFLRGVLAAHAPAMPESSATSKPSGAPTAIGAALRAYRRGELDDARKLLDGVNSPAAHRLRAQILRRERRGEEALAELEGVPSADADRAILFMRLGRYEESRRAFERVAYDTLSPRASEAEFWLGAFDVLAKGWPNGTERWRQLILEAPENRFAWKAAANLSAVGAFINGVERTTWPDAAALASVAPSIRAPAAANTVDTVASKAVDYLVLSQLEDGSWVCPMDAFSFDAKLYTPSITALCGMALLPHANDAKVAAAVRKALDLTLETLKSGRFDAGKGLVGAYSIWGRVTATWFLARAIACGFGGKEITESLRAPLDSLVTKVIASQVKSGGWPYITLEGDESGAGFDPSASFLTAGALLALTEAMRVGGRVDAAALESGLTFLVGMRDADGAYRYMPDLPNTRVSERAPEAAGRGPACALAVLRCGTSPQNGADIARALGVFIDEQDRFGRAFHKSLCHTEPEGFGAHYLLYDYWLALAAASELPADDSRRVRDALLTAMFRHRFEDGSFEDLPGIGRAGATGLALLGIDDANAFHSGNR